MWERGEGSEGPSGTIFLRGIDGSPAIRLAAGAPSAFSQDGKWVLADIGGQKIMLVPTGAGNTRSFEYAEYSDVDSIGFLPDGKQMLISALGKNGKPVLLRLDIASGKPNLIEAKGLTAIYGNGAMISPDGRFLLMVNSEGAAFYYDMDTQTAKAIPHLEPRELPFQWTRDGSSVLVMNRFVVPAEVFKVNISTGARDFFKEIHPPDLTGVDLISSILFTPDEKMFTYGYRRQLTTLYMVENLR